MLIQLSHLRKYYAFQYNGLRREKTDIVACEQQGHRRSRINTELN